MDYLEQDLSEEELQDLKKLKKEKQKERKDTNMELAYKEDDGGWERVNEFHWVRRLNGKQLIYWPSKRKYQYQAKIMRGDVYKFILSVQEKVKRK